MSVAVAAAAALIVLRLAAQLFLLALNRTEVRRWASDDVMDAPTRARAVAYALAKSRFSALGAVWDAAVLAAALFTGILPRLGAIVQAWGRPGSPWTGALFLVLAAVLLGLLSLPWDAWETFGLEARFGFNRSSAGLWIADKAKGFVLGLALGYPLLVAVLAVARSAGPVWWIWGFALFFGFELALIVLYPRLILPLFNRLRPLPEGELRARLLARSDQSGFRAAAIEVMDGSRRSAHANAFFTGFGRFRRIVLFDTLVDDLGAEELEAVLAHEIGHYRLGHVPRGLALAGMSAAAGFALVGWLARLPACNGAFGYPAPNLADSFLVFALLSGLVTYWLAPLGRLLSRRNEYAADAFARRAMGSGRPLIRALRSLAEKNLSNLAPHPWFGAFYHSHPTLAEREKALASGGD